jgi:hypothetical protein
MQDEASVEWTSDEREGLRPYLKRLKKELWDRVWKRESCYAEMERHEEYFSIVPEVSLTTRTWTNSLSKSDLKLFHRLRLFYIPVQSVLYRWRQSSSTTCQYCLLDDETVQHFLTDCEHWSRERRLCGITDCDAYVILHGNNVADIKNLLKFVRLTRRLK